MMVRRLALERLEDRSLLSVSLGMPHAVGSVASVPAIIGHTKIAAVATQLTLHMPQNVPLGTPVMVCVSALDAQGREVRDYAGQISVSSTDGGATLPADGTVTFHRGFAAFQVTFAGIGSQTVTVKDNSVPQLSADATTNVVDPTVVTHFKLRLPEKVPLNQPVDVRLVALNGLNRPVDGYAGPVTFPDPPAGATLPDPATLTFDKGRTAFQVTFTSVGDQTLTVADSTDPTVTVAATTTVIDPAVVTRFALRLPCFVLAGTPVTARLVALNGLGQPVTGFAGSVTFPNPPAGATLPDPTTLAFDQGVLTFQVTFAGSGKQTLTVADSVDATLTASATVYVTTSVPTWGRWDR
jgi:hypothetical protein